MAIADPRSAVRFRGIGQINATFPIDNSTVTYDVTKKGGSAQVGLAVGLSSTATVQLVADGDCVLGKLLRVNADNFATVQIAGAMFLPPGTGATNHPAQGVVGCLLSAAKGYVRSPAALTGSYVQGTQQDIANQRGRQIDTGAVNDVIQGVATACWTVFVEG